MNKKKNLIFLIAVFLTGIAQGQITKGNWLVGGNGSISFVNEDLNDSKVKANHIKLSPDLGWFFIDKLAGGARISLDYSKINYTAISSSNTQFGLGPFVRYYFLDISNRTNLLAEAAYQVVYNSGNNIESDHHSSIAFSLGPVIYFNSSVGLELLTNYEILKYHADNQRTFSFSIGLQIHLERDNNQ